MSLMIVVVLMLVAAAVAREWPSRHAPPATGGAAADSSVVALYRRGVRGYDRRTPAAAIDAIAAFNEAVRRDSTYTEAWTGLGKMYVRMYERSFRLPGVSPDSMLRLAVFAVDRALAQDSTNSDAWTTQAIASRHIDPTDRTLSLRAVRHAIALDSTNATAWHTLAVVSMETGDFETAMRAWQRSVKVNPGYTQGLTFLGLAHMWRRAYDSAVTWTDSARALDPGYFFAWMTLGEVETERGNFARASAAYAAAARLTTEVERVNAMAGSAMVDARAGRTASARALVRQVDSLASAFSPVAVHTSVYIAHTYAALHDPDRAMHWLERFTPSGDLHFQLHLRCDPSFAPIAGDRRFRALLIQQRPPPLEGCRAR